MALVALKILICESASENLWPVKGRVSENTIMMSLLSLQATGRRNHLYWLTPELTVVALLKDFAVNHPLCSFFVHISRFGTYTFSHEHRGCGVSPSKLSLWHFQAAGWLQSDMQAYTWSIWEGRRHISDSSWHIRSREASTGKRK